MRADRLALAAALLGVAAAAHIFSEGAVRSVRAMSAVISVGRVMPVWTLDC